MVQSEDPLECTGETFPPSWNPSGRGGIASHETKELAGNTAFPPSLGIGAKTPVEGG